MENYEKEKKARKWQIGGHKSTWPFCARVEIPLELLYAFPFQVFISTDAEPYLVWASIDFLARILSK